ncbi:hypothetical protein ACRARH_26010 [Phytobacter ursingii]
MNIICGAITWLLTKHETKTMTDQIVYVPPAATAEQPQGKPSTLDALKASFAAKVQFIESGLAVLGAEAEDELVALAEKYL